MLWWVSVAPFGKPVVPEVYWMLIGSSADNSACRCGDAIAVPGATPVGRGSFHSSESSSTTCSQIGGTAHVLR